jgi:hypothetical protein
MGAATTFYFVSIIPQICEFADKERVRFNFLIPIKTTQPAGCEA